MIFLIIILCTILSLLSLVISFYLGFFAFYSVFILKRNDFILKRNGNENAEKNIKYCILIPAHNEEASILQTIRSCQDLHYSDADYDIYVIADNCIDNTAMVSRQAGAKCIERFDNSKLGKGWALAWGFQEVKDLYDAYIVIDADCVFDSEVLNHFNIYFQKGFKVLQANDVSGNPDESFISYVLSVGNFIENEFFYAPKSGINLPVFLRGTGMVIHRDILEKFPWRSYSIAEDMEYSEQLLGNGVKIVFIPDAKVTSNFPASLEQLRIQRTRWASGNLGTRKFTAFRSLIKGIVKKDIVLVDFGMTLLTLSRPLIIFYMLFAFLFTGLCSFFLKNIIITMSCWCSFIALNIMFFYIFSAIIFMGLNRKRLEYLIRFPKVFLELFIISVLGLIGKDKHNWKKTPR